MTCNVQHKIGPPHVQRLGQSSTRINEEYDQVPKMWWTDFENSSLLVLGEIAVSLVVEGQQSKSGLDLECIPIRVNPVQNGSK